MKQSTLFFCNTFPCAGCLRMSQEASGFFNFLFFQIKYHNDPRKLQACTDGHLLRMYSVPGTIPASPQTFTRFNPHNDPLRWGEEACGKQNKRTPKMSVSYVTQNLDARVTCNRWVCYLHGKGIFEDIRLMKDLEMGGSTWINQMGPK